jgi:hypothetical protein
MPVYLLGNEPSIPTEQELSGPKTELDMTVKKMFSALAKNQSLSLQPVA